MDTLKFLQIFALIVGAYSQSYSQVRYASTRRNGTAYDAYSVLSNPALANHRLPIYPQPPSTPVTSPPVTTTTAPVAAVDVQSAVQDAIQQGNFHQMPFYGMNHLVPQYTDTLNSADMHSADLQHAQSEVHQVRVPPKTTPQTNEEEERIRDYYHRQTEVVPTTAPEPETTTDCLACRLFHEEFVKNQEKIKVMTNKHTPAPQNALPEVVTKAMSTPKPADKKNFTAPATNELFSINDALVHQQKLPAQLGSAPNVPSHAMTPTQLFSRPQTVINRLQNGFAMQPQGFPATAPNAPQGSHLLPPGAILIDPSKGGVRPQMFSGHQQRPNMPMNPGQPQGPNRPINAGQPQGPNMPMNAGQPQAPNMPMNAGQPQGPNMPMNAGQPQAPNFPQNAAMPQMSNPQVQQGSSIPNMPGMPQLSNTPGNTGSPQLFMNSGTSQGSSIPINPALLQSFMNAGGSNMPINAGLIQSLMNAAGQGSINPQMLQGALSNLPLNAFNPQITQNGIAQEPNRRVNSMPNDQIQSNPQAGTIRGPMGIHIPIPPKSVPAHTVMGPPMSMPPMQNGNGMPTRKNGGFLDSIKNFFAGSMFSNGQRARFLDDDDALLLDEDNNSTTIGDTNSTAIEELTDTKNISSNETVDSDVEVPEVEEGFRTKREVETNETLTTESGKNGTKTLLEEIGAYVRKTIHRLRDETERITTPLWPTIRDTVRTFLGSSKSDSTTTRKPPTTEDADVERRSAERKRFSSPVDDEVKENVDGKRQLMEQDLQKILRVGETTEKPMEQLKLAAATSLLPRCAIDVENKNYCLQDSDYPINLLKKALQQDDSVVACNTTLGRNIRQRQRTAEPGVCVSPIFKVMPLRAKNQDGVWKLIVNVDSCHQIVRIQKCHPSCGAQAATRTHCKQVEATYTLIAFDSKHGFHLDKFQFPSTCWCSS